MLLLFWLILKQFYNKYLLLLLLSNRQPVHQAHCIQNLFLLNVNHVLELLLCL